MYHLVQIMAVTKMNWCFGAIKIDVDLYKYTLSKKEAIHSFPSISGCRTGLITGEVERISILIETTHFDISHSSLAFLLRSLATNHVF